MACSTWGGGGLQNRLAAGSTPAQASQASASFVYRHRTPHSQCGKAGSTPARGTRSSFTGCSSAWMRARAWGARGRWFESSHPDFFLWVWLSLVERTVRIREVAGSSPATQTRSTRSFTGYGPMVGLSSDTRAVLVRFQVPRLMLEVLLLDAIGSQRGRLPREQGSIPCRSARNTRMPPLRRWFARLFEKQEDQVRFLGTALLLHKL